VVTDGAGRALYFSRAPIPWNRDGAPAGLASQRDLSGARRHIGIYAYRVAALLRLAALPVSALETREKLEQLRALEDGFDIRVGEAVERPGPDVNTLADLERVRAQIAQGHG
jgi:3-deoxy-manno-octulosonate cytidylyltransferase (CMP-KDO synthetase)